MKREEIHVMEAGPEADAMVASLVMGETLDWEHSWAKERPANQGPHRGYPSSAFLCKSCGQQWTNLDPPPRCTAPAPVKYSADIAHAWKVVEALRARRRDLVLNDGTNHFPPMYEVQAGIDAHGPWTFCWFGLEGGIDGRCARAATAPLAICRAALLTTLSEEEYAEGRRWPDGMRVQDGKLVQA